MYGKNRLINFLAATLFIVVLSLISACSQIQNLTLTPQNGNCVQASMYGINESAAIANFPVIANNPTQAPYCMSFTLNNGNSSGQGGSNMQITYPGLVLTGLQNESTTPFSLMDPIASGESDVITNQSQTIGNIALFDPNNCATIGGANSITIQAGQSCTFYLQILNEAYAPNSVPLFLSYSSYNGNSSNTIIASIYQHVNLYGGTGNGLYEVLQSGESQAQWVNNGINAPSGQIGSLISDSYGNVYFANGTQVYKYNGITLIKLGTQFATNVNSLTFDVNGNLYAGTNGSGIYIYNTSQSPNAWVSFTDTSGNLNTSSIISGITSTGFIPKSTSQNLYVTTMNKAYTCSIAQSSTISTSCTFNNISSLSGAPTAFNADAFDSDNFGLYVGSNSNAFDYIESQNVWQQFSFSGNNVTGNVAGVFHQTVSAVIFTYLGIINNGNESSVFNCNTTSCSPLISSGAHNSVSGNAYSITADGDGDVFVGGNNLNSPDFLSTPNTPGAYLYFAGGTNVWQSITNGSLPANSNINSMTISSALLGQ